MFLQESNMNIGTQPFLSFLGVGSAGVVLTIQATKGPFEREERVFL